MIFLSKPAKLVPNNSKDASKSWTEQWQQKIVSGGGLPQRAIDELFASTENLTHIIEEKLGSVQDRCINGMVVGNVQSGKTASMVGLTASAFDLGIDIVVILTGTDNTLRQQTHSRFNYDLFQYNDELRISMDKPLDPRRKVNPGQSGKSTSAIQDFMALTYLTGLPEFLAGDGAPHRLSANKKKGIKTQITALKNPTLAKLGDLFRETNSHLAAFDMQPLNILVIDDESDFASAPGKKKAKSQYYIQDLWTDSYEIEVKDDAGTVGSETLESFPDGKLEHIKSTTQRQAIYVGYTATPHGIMRNRFKNLLKPEDFVFTLRASGGYHDNDELEPSERVYYEAERKVSDWYCGGHVYHQWLEAEGHDNFLLNHIAPINRNDLVQDKFIEAICDYYVSAGLRWIEKGFDPSKPITHTMFVHNHANTDTHFTDILGFLFWIMIQTKRITEEDAKKEVFKLVSKFQTDTKAKNDLSKYFDLIKKTWDTDKENSPKRALIKWMESVDGKSMMEKSYKSFTESRATLVELRPGCRTNDQLPPFDDDLFEAIKEVVNQTKFRFINGNGCAEPLNFDTTYDFDSDGEIRPFDAFSIIIGGNMLGRGVTLKNLAVTYFQKSAEEKAQDTYIQRQRWFGYRGGMIEFCRVYLPPDTDDFLLRSHMDLETAIDYWSLLNEDEIPLTDEKWWSIITSDANIISTKSDRGVSLELNGWHYPTWFTESPNLDTGYKGTEQNAKHNHDLVVNMIKKVIDEGTKLDPAVTPHPGKPNIFHGYLLGTTLATNEKFGDSLESTDVAEFLDQFLLTNHHPASTCPYIVAFDRIAQQLGKNSGDIHSHFSTLTNANAMTGENLTKMTENRNPYLIAAYLRDWSALWDASQTTAGIPAGLATGWNPCEPPQFNIVAWGAKSRKGVPTTTRIIISGKEFYTYATPLNGDGTSRAHFSGFPTDPGKFGGWGNLDNFKIVWSSEAERKKARQKGENGIMVLRFADRGPKNKSNTVIGKTDKYHRPKIWINIPEGGPKFTFV